MRANKRKSPKSVVDFISEAGMLKRVRRSGWSVLGIRDAESVAEHSFRCAVIGYMLACMEKVPAERVIMMTLFNDIHEARITDLHKMAQRYIDAYSAENKAFKEQIALLPENIRKGLADTHTEYIDQKTKESLIARDADILECLIQAKEYHAQGFTEAVKFMRKAPLLLKTDSAKEIWRYAKKNDINDWWVNLSNFKR
ncbi:MAG: HD domain-containing protein [Candidatus Omnitrophota bacterium]